jgi:hypothetical protein
MGIQSILLYLRNKIASAALKWAGCWAEWMGLATPPITACRLSSARTSIRFPLPLCHCNLELFFKIAMTHKKLPLCQYYARCAFFYGLLPCYLSPRNAHTCCLDLFSLLTCKVEASPFGFHSWSFCPVFSN